ncbi:MAG TPA: hypothetical protein VLK29_01945 [Luteimonas sp.]|nr:hypothetical protein [Luteimonas sp.]
MKSSALPASMLVTLALSAWATPARALDVDRSYLSHGTANCQAALPVFDGNIRKRPKAIANEGTSAAFITCDFENGPNGLRKISGVAIYLKNRSAATAVVNCTLVQGFGDTQYEANVTKSQELAADGEGALVWTSDDYAGNRLTVPSTSCSLPPGVEIFGTQLEFPEYVGS